MQAGTSSATRSTHEPPPTEPCTAVCCVARLASMGQSKACSSARAGIESPRPPGAHSSAACLREGQTLALATLPCLFSSPALFPFQDFHLPCHRILCCNGDVADAAGLLPAPPPPPPPRPPAFLFQPSLWTDPVLPPAHLGFCCLPIVVSIAPCRLKEASQCSHRVTTAAELHSSSVLLVSRCLLAVRRRQSDRRNGSCAAAATRCCAARCRPCRCRLALVPLLLPRDSGRDSASRCRSVQLGRYRRAQDVEHRLQHHG